MTNLIRVAFLSYDGLTDPLGQSQILPYMLGLAEKGNDITIISFEKPDRYELLRERIEMQCKIGKVHWVPLKYHKNPPILSTIVDLFHLGIELRALHKKSSFHIVHCRSYPTSVVGQWFKKRYGVKFIFDMRGFWADERVEGGLWNLRNPLYKLIYRYFKRKENQFFKHADYVISLTHNAMREIRSRGIMDTPFAIIPTCVDLNLFDPQKIRTERKETLRSQLGLKAGAFVLLYLGSWSTWYLNEEMLNFFSNLKKQRPDAKFLIVTLERIDLSNYEFKDDVILTESPREDVPYYISLADASLFFIKPSFSKKGTYATKMGEIMAMEIPIITNPGWGDAEEIIKEAGGYLYRKGVTIVMDEITKAENIRMYCRENLSLESGVESYNRVYFNLCVRLKS